MRLLTLVFAAALLLLAPIARAQQPETQSLLDEIVGRWKLDQGERLDQKNCDYTAIDVTKQAFNRAGLTNKAVGPVVIGALENACKGAADALGFGIATTGYSAAKCIYDYYTSGNNARSLALCLGIEAGGFAAGKLVDLLDVDPVTGAFTGRVIDRIGDDLKAGGLDDLAANAKAGELRQFAARLREALEQAKRAASDAQQNETVFFNYPGLVYGCNVDVAIQFTKAKPPTNGPNSILIVVGIADCNCAANPPVGRALERASLRITVPVDMTPGPGGAVSWLPNLASMRTTITSKCCGAGETTTITGFDPGRPADRGVVPGGGVIVQVPPQKPPEPPAPPRREPTFAELCPECVPITRDIENDRYDIEAAQGRVARADEDLRAIRNEKSNLTDEISRLQRLIQSTKKRVRGLSTARGGGRTITQTISDDGKKVTTTTYDDGRVETREDRTGNHDIDSANERIVADRAKLREIEPREQAARDARARAEADKAAAEAKLRADEARLKECEEACRKRRTSPQPPPAIAVPGGGGVPVRPPQQPPAAPPPPTSYPPSQPPRELEFPAIPPAACDACEGAYQVALATYREAEQAKASQEWAAKVLEDMDAYGAGRTPPHGNVKPELWRTKTPAEKAEARQFFEDMFRENTAKLLVAVEKITEAVRALQACNRQRCSGVVVDTVIGVAGTNPFNPDNPIGTGGVPVPPAGPGTLQLSSATYSAGEGGAVLIVVTRSGGSKGAVSVQYATGGGSASPGVDFAPVSGVLSWADGDTSPKSFSVAIIDDTQVEGTESFAVILAGPTGGATLGSPSQGTVSIADNDSPTPPQQTGALQFSASSYSTAEGQGSVLITVTRNGGSSGPASVQYFTGPSSATAGQDYGATNGALSWADGDAGAKSFTVTIIDDNLVEGPETFFVTLNNAVGATLGAPATATVTIADNDQSAPVGPCGPQGHAWQPNTGAAYMCSGSCDPSPSPQTLTVNGMTVTITPFHAGGAATFNGCSATLNSDSSTLTYFGQANHRATITRSSNNSYTANITSSGGGSCFFSCNRSGP